MTDEIDTELARASAYDSDTLLNLLGSAVETALQGGGAGSARRAGKTFFERFRVELQHVVCGKNGPYEQLIKGLATEKDLPKLIVVAILTRTPSLGGVAITTLIAIYLALLIVRSGLAAYCDTPEHSSP